MKREFESGDKAMPRTVYAAETAAVAASYDRHGRYCAAETAGFRADKSRPARSSGPRKSENPRNERI